jgi:hypothetical protein
LEEIKNLEKQMKNLETQADSDKSNVDVIKNYELIDKQNKELKKKLNN